MHSTPARSLPRLARLLCAALGLLLLPARPALARGMRVFASDAHGIAVTYPADWLAYRAGADDPLALAHGADNAAFWAYARRDGTAFCQITCDDAAGMSAAQFLLMIKTNKSIRMIKDVIERSVKAENLSITWLQEPTRSRIGPHDALVMQYAMGDGASRAATFWAQFFDDVNGRIITVAYTAEGDAVALEALLEVNALIGNLRFGWAASGHTR